MDYYAFLMNVCIGVNIYSKKSGEMLMKKHHSTFDVFSVIRCFLSCCFTGRHFDVPLSSGARKCDMNSDNRKKRKCLHSVVKK